MDTNLNNFQLSNSHVDNKVGPNSVPVNIFRSVSSKLPEKAALSTVAKLAKLMCSHPMLVDRKEQAKLVTFNTYKQEAESRGTCDIVFAHAVCGDWDKGFDAAIFERGLAQLQDAGAQVIAYQTYNHKPEAPRWRIFVFLDEPIAPADYRICWEGLNSVFAGKLDGNAKDCARLNYWPSCPPEQTREFRTLNIEVV